MIIFVFYMEIILNNESAIVGIYDTYLLLEKKYFTRKKVFSFATWDLTDRHAELVQIFSRRPECNKLGLHFLQRAD